MPSGPFRSASALLRGLLATSLGLVLTAGCPAQRDGPVPSVTQSEADALLPAAPVARVETADAWLDLIAQRPNAVLLQHGAVVIDLGLEASRSSVSLTSRKQLELGQVVEGRAAGLILGRGASIDVPIDGELSTLLVAPQPDMPEPLAMAISVHPLAENQSMTVLLNEKPLAHLKLHEGWQRRTFSLPVEVARSGENRVRFHFRNTQERGEQSVSAAISRVEVGTHERITAPPPGEAPPVYGIAAAKGDDDGGLSVSARGSKKAGRTLLLAPGSGLAYYVQPPSRGRLVLDIRGEGALRVTASTDADHQSRRPPTVLIDEPLRPTGHRPTMDLTAWGENPVRLAIEVRSQRTDRPAELSLARIEAPRSVPVDRRARRPRDIIIVTVEGMRADALEIGRRPALGTIDDFLAASLLFERVYAASPAAVPSHAAWLSSVAPPVHLTINGTFVADRQVLLSEALNRTGYVRSLFTANVDVNADRGLAQGFDRYLSFDGNVDENSATSVMAALLRARPRTGRRFMMANLSDPQAPYEPPRELLRDVTAPVGSPLPHLTHIWVGRVRLGKTIPIEPELEYMRRLYRGELQVIDRALDDLIEGLRREGKLDETIIVLMGVHGEEFYEHEGAGHARTLFDESLRVPLAIRAPPLLAPGRVAAAVDLLDLAPTLLDLIGVPAPDLWQGESLVSVIDDPQPPPRACIAYLGDGSRAVVVGRHKLVLGPGRQERYADLGENPSETVLEEPGYGIGLRLVRSALAWQLEYETQWRRARWGTGANLTPAFAQDLGM